MQASVSNGIVLLVKTEISLLGYIVVAFFIPNAQIREVSFIEVKPNFVCTRIEYKRLLYRKNLHMLVICIFLATLSGKISLFFAISRSLWATGREKDFDGYRPSIIFGRICRARYLAHPFQMRESEQIDVSTFKRLCQVSI